MPYTINYNPETRIIEMKIHDDFRFSEGSEIISELIRVIKEQNCFLILNVMRAAKMKLSTFDIYELPKLLANTFDSSEVNSHKLKRALVVEKDLEDYKFFETVTGNRGQQLRLFFDLDEAKKWLLEK